MKVPFGLDSNGAHRHASSVANGLACECRCPDCGVSLVAKNNGMIKVDHFAHEGGAPESCSYDVIPYLIEYLFDRKLNDKTLVVPEYRKALMASGKYGAPISRPPIKFDSQELSFDAIELLDASAYNSRYKSMKVTLKGRNLIVLFGSSVTTPAFMQGQFQKAEMSAMYVCLSDIIKEVYDLEAIDTYASRLGVTATWIFNRRYDAIYAKALESLYQEIAESDARAAKEIASRASVRPGNKPLKRELQDNVPLNINRFNSKQVIERRNTIIQSAKALADAGIEGAAMCNECMIYQPRQAQCRYCNSSDLRAVTLTDAFVSSISHRLDSGVAPHTSLRNLEKVVLEGGEP